MRDASSGVDKLPINVTRGALARSGGRSREPLGGEPRGRLAVVLGGCALASSAPRRIPVALRLARGCMPATIGLVLCVAVVPAVAEASTQTAPETRPVVDITSVSATLEGWLGSEQPEEKAPKEGPEKEGPPEKGRAPKEPVAPADPRMEPASWYFEYASGTSCTGAGHLTTTEHIAVLQGFHEARAAVTGLRPGTEYTVCLVDWHNVLSGVSFTTLAAAGEPHATLGASESSGPPPSSSPTTGQASKPGPKTSKLARALGACKKKPKRKRAACVRHAHRKYSQLKK